MEYREYKPNKHLAGFIECYWSAYSERPPFREKERLIPDGTIELMFNFGDPYSQFKHNQRVQVKGSHVIGIRRESLVISQTSKQDFFSIRFKLGGLYPFIKIPIHLFSNDFYTLTELFGNQFSDLEEQLYEAIDNDERVQLVENYFLNRLDGIPDEYAFVSGFSNSLLQTSSGPGRMKELMLQYNTNYKTTERRFKTVLGLTPSELMRIHRFNKSVLAMYSCRYDSLTAIAYACDYYDQAHFIREFKKLTGYSPREFLEEQFTIVQVIQPALAERLSKSYNLLSP